MTKIREESISWASSTMSSDITRHSSSWNKYLSEIDTFWDHCYKPYISEFKFKKELKTKKISTTDYFYDLNCISFDKHIDREFLEDTYMVLEKLFSNIPMNSKKPSGLLGEIFGIYEDILEDFRETYLNDFKKSNNIPGIDNILEILIKKSEVVRKIYGFNSKEYTDIITSISVIRDL